ncbi:hypothetical protein [Novosphingobium sp.]|uniref:hypothetical protein n=1 Tax=Novosphingobium sp. TaxID=1874826 RepID=UPI0031D11BC2
MTPPQDTFRPGVAMPGRIAGLKLRPQRFIALGGGDRQRAVSGCVLLVGIRAASRKNLPTISPWLSKAAIIRAVCPASFYAWGLAPAASKRRVTLACPFNVTPISAVLQLPVSP